MRKLPRWVAWLVVLLVLGTAAAVGYGVVNAWANYPLIVVVLGLIGIITIVVGILVLINQAEVTAEYSNQATLQAYEMAHARTVAIEPVYEYDYAEPLNWAVRKTEDGSGYQVVPLLEGQPVWSAALPELYPNTYDGKIEAQEAAYAMITRKALT